MHTLAGVSSVEQTIRRSRFVTHAGPVPSEAATLEFYERVADPAATHNCWAWRCDLRTRSNDDGEPSGTAGRPILGVIEGRELDRVMVVVTRYYGGIKLGVGGLKRAYSGGAARCLDGARLVPLVRRQARVLEADFEFADAIHQLLERFDVRKTGERFEAAGLRLRVEVPSHEIGAFERALRDLSRGQARLRHPR